MRTSVKKWGNSLAFRIPLSIANELDVRENSPLECSVRDGILIIKPIPSRPKYTLEELLAGINKDNIHGEIDFGLPIGRESW